MNAEIVNLRRARKAKARVEKEETAAQNRIDFGRTKAEKARTRTENDRASARHDAGQREADD